VLQRDFLLHEIGLTNEQVRIIHSLGEEVALVPRDVVDAGEKRIFACSVRKNDLTFLAVVKENRVRLGLTS